MKTVSRRQYNQQYYQENRAAILAQKQEYRDKNKEAILSRQQKDRLRAKIEALTYYGGGKLQCVCCGFSNIDALSIDHIDGGGAKHRRSLQRDGNPFYRWLEKQGFPLGYQTLCMNCQWVKRMKKDKS